METKLSYEMNNKLNLAFKQMKKEKIYAVRDLECCQTCGGAEIVGRATDDGNPKGFIGYCFYHAQDAEMLDKTGEVYLAYGTLIDCMIDKASKWLENQLSVITAKKIVEILQANGLEVVWDGDNGHRILVRNKT